MSYFFNVSNGEELKSKYRELCQIHHPDKGGDNGKMQQINLEYAKLKKQFCNSKFNNSSTTAKTNVKQPNAADEFAEKMRKAQEEIKRKKDGEDIKKTQKSKTQTDADNEKAKAKFEREEQKRKESQNDAQRVADEKKYKSQFFPNQETVLCVAQGGASRLLTSWEADSFIRCLQRDGIGVVMHQNHFEYSIKKQKRK